MNILSTQGLAKTHGIKTLFENLSLGLDERDRLGVIGANGSGKSTLLRILAGLESADAGTIAWRQGLPIAFLPQQPVYDPKHTVLDHIFAAPEGESAGGQAAGAALVRDYERTAHSLARDPDNARLIDRLGELSQAMDAAGAWELETRARTVLTHLGVEAFDVPMARLSGGMRRRVALARTLVGELFAPSGLLVLDEPTNHLDADTVAWIEEWLGRYGGAVALVTHDRYFLDRIATRLIELDRGRAMLVEGNFETYLEQKAAEEEAAVRAEERRQSILRRELAWLRRGARARTTKAKAHVERVHTLIDERHVRERESLRFDSGGRRLGKTVVELEGVSKQFGELAVVRDFSFVFAPGDRVGIVGPNGSGKSTLANLIVGRLTPDAGHVRVGETVRFAYYDQEAAGLDPERRVLDTVKIEGGEALRTPDGRVRSAESVMEQFLFTSQMLRAPVDTLSGGERRRLYLVITLMRDPNFLILDEPTNDLDIPTLQALEAYLEGFSGCLVVISHDRYLLDRTVDRLLAPEGDWEPGHWGVWPAPFETYRKLHDEALAERRAEAVHDRARRDRVAAAKTSTGDTKARVDEEHATVGEPVAAQPSQRRKLSYNEKRELERLETEIPRMEERLEALNDEVAAAGADFERLHALTAEQGRLMQQLDDAMTRWADLADRA